MSPNQSVVDLCPHHFVRILSRHQMFLCANRGRLSSFRGQKGLIVIGITILTNTEVIIIIGCLIAPVQHQKHNETLTLPQATCG